MLSHPRPLLRDTQTFAALRQIAKTKRPGLKKLAELELGVKIQAGAHSSVTDARATMALYRVHKPQWEHMVRRETEAFHAKTVKKPKSKRGADALDDVDENGDDDAANGATGAAAKKRKRAIRDEPEAFPGGGRKGVSSGLGLIVKRRDGQPVNRKQRSHEAPTSESAMAVGGANWWEAM